MGPEKYKCNIKRVLPSSAKQRYTGIRRDVRLKTLNMEGFINGILGGIVPAALMVIIYLFSVAGRLAKMETDIYWLIRELKDCRRRSRDLTR